MIELLEQFERDAKREKAEMARRSKEYAEAIKRDNAEREEAEMAKQPNQQAKGIERDEASRCPPVASPGRGVEG